MLPDRKHVHALYLKHLASQTPSLRRLVRDAIHSSKGDLDSAVRIVRRALVAREVGKLCERKKAARLARIVAGETIALRVARRRRGLGSMADHTGYHA